MNVMAILSDSGTVNGFIRSFLSIFDYAAYGLLKYIYVLFFNVTSAEFLSGELIYNFFNRIQLIIGVFMIFQLTMTIIKGIVNPDSFMDSKTGIGNLVMRIMVSLSLLALIVPLNVSNPRNEYERQINNNGILFGTLYSLQNRILSNNTIGRLVLGTDSTNYTSSTAENYDGLKTAANRFATTILKVFYKWSDDANPENPNASCTVDSNVSTTYNNDDSDPNDIISLVNEECTNLFNSNYVFSLEFPFISAIVGFIFAFIMIKMTFEVAVRAVKIAMLRLIAPIPIISYMDPKGGKDGAFSSWVKTLSSTYLDLFIHLVVIYFVMFVIQGMVDDGGNVHAMVSSGFLGGLTFIIIWIGLFIFAKDAPKFFKQALGIKDNGGKFFSAFGQAMGLGASAVGAIGSGIAGAKASRLADQTREALEQKPPGTYSDRLLNRGKHFIAGLAGGVAGGYTGAQAALTNKDNKGFGAAVEAMKKRNQAVLTRGNDGSTLFGRGVSTARNIFTGDGSAAKMEREISSWEARQKAMDAIGSRVSGEMVKQDWTFGSGGTGFFGTDSSGARVSLDGSRFNYKRFMASIAKANAAGEGFITVNDEAGTTYRIDMDDADIMKGNVLKFNEDDYIKKVTSGVQSDKELESLIKDAMAKGGSGWNGTDFDSDRRLDITSRDDYKKSSEGIGQKIRDAKRENMVNKANDTYSGKKS